MEPNSSSSAFVDTPPHKQGGMLHPAAEEHERAGKESDEYRDFSRHGSKEYWHWRMTGETQDGLLEIPDVEPTESAEPADPLEHLTDAERGQWLKDGTLPEKPAKSQQEKIAKEAKERSGESVDEKDHPDYTSEDSVRDHVSKVTKEQHEQAVQNLPKKLDKELLAMPDGKHVLEMAGKTEKLPVKLQGVLIHALADVPNSAGVFRLLALNPAALKQMQTQSPEQVIEIVHALSARVAVEGQARTQVADARKRYPDFDKVVFNDQLPVRENSPVFNFCVFSKHGADVMYALGQDPKELFRINKLHPIAQIRELTKIESRVASTRAKPTTRRITNAPPPTRVLGGNSATSADEVEQAVREDDFESYKAHANARDLARRRK
jgi:hypothetical protein